MIQSAQCALFSAGCPLSAFVAWGAVKHRGSRFRTTTAGVQPGRPAAGRPGRIHFLPQYGRGTALRLPPGATSGRGPQPAPGRGLAGGIPRRPGRARQRPQAPASRSPARAAGPTAPNSRSKSRARWSPPRQERPTPEPPWPSRSAAPATGMATGRPGCSRTVQPLRSRAGPHAGHDAGAHRRGAGSAGRSLSGDFPAVVLPVLRELPVRRGCRSRGVRRARRRAQGRVPPRPPDGAAQRPLLQRAARRGPAPPGSGGHPAAEHR